ncbi:PREDICTED: neuferricin, partial [Merops nubicus]|uniref:neuferricin n=1 Tax=Merops nubicus TaxID=57421 RepID=UPI0004F06E7E
KLVGRYYDEEGAPTEALRQAEAAIEEALKLQAESEEEKQQFPACNSEWSSAKGSRFWCSTQRSSGPPGGQPAPQHGQGGHLAHPQLQEYEGCHPLAQQCFLPP